MSGIKAKEVGEIEVIDPDSNLPVHLTVLKLETGCMMAVDSSYLEQDIGPVFSSFDEGVTLELEDDDA